MNIIVKKADTKGKIKEYTAVAVIAKGSTVKIVSGHAVFQAWFGKTLNSFIAQYGGEVDIRIAAEPAKGGTK